MKLTLSRQGAKFIGAWEGFRANPYNDSRGFATIGIGHLIGQRPVNAADRTRWKNLAYSRALDLLQTDVRLNALNTLERALKVPLTVPQVDALCSVGVNCGPGSLETGHSIMTAVNSKPKTWRPLAMRAWHKRVAAAIMLWAHPVELTRRRRSEVTLFRTGKYTRASGNSDANS